jgi:hypothetical protein
VESGPSHCALIDHRESPGATTTRSVAPAARSVTCGSFACGVALAVAVAGETARTTAHSANATSGAYAHRLSLVNKVSPLPRVFAIAHPRPRTGQHGPGGTQKGIPPVRGCSAGAFGCQLQYRMRAQRFAALAHKFAALQKGNREQNQYGER